MHGPLTFVSALAALLLASSMAMAQAPDAVGPPASEPSPVLDTVAVKPLEPCLGKLRTPDQSTDPFAASLGSPIVGPQAKDWGARALCDDVFATADLAHKRSCAALVVQKANLSPADSVTAMHLLGLLFEMKR